MLEIIFDKNVFDFFVGFRRYSKAFKKVASLEQVFDNLEHAIGNTEEALGIAEKAVGMAENCIPVSKLREVVRNAMAYAWEVGKGAPMTAVLDASPENPFMNTDWADAVYG